MLQTRLKYIKGYFLQFYFHATDFYDAGCTLTICEYIFSSEPAIMGKKDKIANCMVSNSRQVELFFDSISVQSL